MNHANRAPDCKCSFLNDLLNQATANNGNGHPLIAHIRSATLIGKPVGLQLLWYENSPVGQARPYVGTATRPAIDRFELLTGGGHRPTLWSALGSSSVTDGF